MRLDRLSADNRRTQGPERRAWYARHSPEHLRQIAVLVEQALRARAPAAPRAAIVLGAGACTELPLERLARGCAAVTLMDVDVSGMADARDRLPAALRPRVQLVQAELTGGVSAALMAELRAQPWAELAALSPGGHAALEAAAGCLERVVVPDPPRLPHVAPGGAGLVISSLVLTQLFGLPLLDVLDTLDAFAPTATDAREASPRYAAAANAFRRRVARAHLTLIGSLLAAGGVAVLVSDAVGYLLAPPAGAHAHGAREALAVLPPDVLAVPADLELHFTVEGSLRRWEWLVAAPRGEVPGRRYDVFGAVLRPRAAPSGGPTRW